MPQKQLTVIGAVDIIPGDPGQWGVFLGTTFLGAIELADDSYITHINGEAPRAHTNLIEAVDYIGRGR